MRRGHTAAGGACSWAACRIASAGRRRAALRCKRVAARSEACACAAGARATEGGPRPVLVAARGLCAQPVWRAGGSIQARAVKTVAV